RQNHAMRFENSRISYPMKALFESTLKRTVPATSDGTWPDNHDSLLAAKQIKPQLSGIAPLRVGAIVPRGRNLVRNTKFLHYSSRSSLRMLRPLLLSFGNISIYSA